MKYALLGIGGYLALLFLAEKQLSAEAQACHDAPGSPNVTECAGYIAVKTKWGWLPRPSNALAFGTLSAISQLRGEQGPVATL